ncbi:MAG: outer membrane protein transport protein [Pseudomonadota bacterium]
MYKRLSFLMVLTLPLSANAAGFAVKESSAALQGTSFASATSGTNVENLFYNPAASAFVKDTQIYTSASFITANASVKNISASDTALLGNFAQSQSGSPTTSDYIEDSFVPSFALATPINNEFSFGLAVNVPFGIALNYSENWAGRYYNIDTELETINIVPTLTYAPNKKVAFSAGPQIQYAHVRFYNAIDQFNIYSLNSLSPPSLNIDDGFADISGDSWGLGWTVGFMWVPEKATRIGFAYKSLVAHDFEGDAEFSNISPGLAGIFTDTGVGAKANFPASYHLGVSHDVTDRLTLMGDVIHTEWSSFYEIRIDYDSALSDSVSTKNFDDSTSYAIGAEYKYNDDLTLRTGFMYDDSPTGDVYRSPRIPDSERYWASLGAGYKFTESFMLNAAYSHIWMNDAAVNLTGNSATSENVSSGNLSADYEKNIHIFSLSARFSF